MKNKKIKYMLILVLLIISLYSNKVYMHADYWDSYRTLKEWAVSGTTYYVSDIQAIDGMFSNASDDDYKNLDNTQKGYLKTIIENMQLKNNYRNVKSEDYDFQKYAEKIEVTWNPETQTENSNTQGSSQSNIASGAEYWGVKGQQSFFDQYRFNKSFNGTQVDIIIDKCAKAPDDAIKALTEQEIGYMIEILEIIGTDDSTSARIDSEEKSQQVIDFLEDLLDNSNKTGEQTESIKNLQKTMEKIKEEIIRREAITEDVINDPNTGAVNPDDIPEQKEEDPMKGTLGNYIPNTPHTIDEIINEADSFINTGKKEQKSIPISSDSVTLGSGLIYNILLAIAVVVAVIVGLYLAIKFMMSSAEDKAKVKEMLIPYIAGCIVIFSTFTIWKLVVTILGNIA